MPICDEIDPDHCQNVRISNCQIQCADDCIVFKDTALYRDRGPCHYITAVGCTLICTATAIKFGSESVDHFENITVTACTLKSSSRGFGIQLRDQGSVRNVIFTNSTIETRLFDDHFWGKAEPIHISVTRRFKLGFQGLPDWNKVNRLGRVSNILCANLICTSENGIVLVGELNEGESGTPIDTVMIKSCLLNIKKWTKWPGGELDLRPFGGPLPGVSSGIREGKTDPGVRKQPFSAVYVENARRVSLDEVQVHWAPDLPDYYRHALEARNAPDLDIGRFKGESANPEKYEPMRIS